MVSQLLSAAKQILPQQKKTLDDLEKNEFFIPLGKALVDNIVAIGKGALVKDLSCNDVEKVQVSALFCLLYMYIRLQ